MKKSDLLTTALCLFAVIPGIIFYSRLPESMPVHFDISNQPDNFVSKPFALFGIPIILCVLQIICCYSASKSSQRKNMPEFVNALSRFIIPVTAFIEEITIIMFSLDVYKNPGTVALCLLAVIFIVFGNYLPKCRRNSLFGIKLPSTLKSDRIWDKTHHLAGWIFIISGIILIPLSLNMMFIPAIIIVFLAVLIPSVYSYTIK